MLKSNLKRIFFLSLFALMGCQTHPYIISESYLPVSDHRRAIVAAIGEPRTVSQNGREITSFYHDRNFKYVDESKKPKIRYFTKVVVLGPRRPYEVSVEVIKEQRDPDTKQYIEQGLDDSLSQIRVNEIANVLNQSREKPQSVDVENPF